MRRYETRLWLLICTFLLFGSANLLHAATYNIPYTLAASGQVSMNIYDSNGHIVRELLHAMPRGSGANTEIWDGLDNNGNAVPASSYTWKLLRTPSGLTAHFLTNVGGNYSLPASPHDSFSDKPPGDHDGPQGIAVDSSGVYLTSNGAENVAGLIKQSVDGTTRDWSEDDSQGFTAATDGTYIYTGSDTIYKRKCSDGTLVTSWPVTYLGAHYPSAIALSGSSIVAVYGPSVGFPTNNQNELQWFDTTSGAVLDSAAVPSPGGVAIDSAGTVYVTTGSTVSTLTRANHTLVPFITGLDTPTVIDIDKSNGDILVFCAGATQQVLRYSSTGTLKNTYGQHGGRVDGLYTTTMQLSFLNITDLKADGSGGFFIAEPNSAPVRVSHFDVNGNLIKEWYGGQGWAPWVCPEPNDPTEVWMESTYGYVMRCTVNYTTNTWTVHSTYKINGLASGLILPQVPGNIWGINIHNGTIYLTAQQGFMPCVLKVVEGANWSLQPVCFGFQFFYDGYRNDFPPWVAQWAADKGFPAGTTCSWLWTDANGDGIPQESEVTCTAAAPGGSAGTFDSNFNMYVDTNQSNIPMGTLPVTGWNAVGAPEYAGYPTETIVGSFPLTRVVSGWGPYSFPDATTGDLYSAVNCLMTGWGTAGDAYMIKFNPDGSEAWESGKGGGDHFGNPRGQIAALRSIAGTTNGCIAAMDFYGDGGTVVDSYTRTATPTSYVWDQDGLYVGGLFDSVDLVNARWENYRLASEDLNCRLYTDPVSGAVTFFGTGENQGYIYSITGWDNWFRTSGTVVITTPSTALTGQGLNGDYYSSSNFTNLISSRLDPTVNFAWGTAPPTGSGLPAGSNYSVRWTGTVVPKYGPTYYDMTQGFQAGDLNGDEYNDSQLIGAASAYCQFGFHGTSVKWMGRMDTSGAIANVYIDGVLQATQANFYSATPQYQVAIPGGTITGLANADHTIRMVDTGVLGGVSALNPQINVDYWQMDGGLIVDDAGEPYTFYVNAADGARLWIDGELLVNDPTDKSLPVEHSELIMLQGGSHTLRLDYYDDSDPSAVTLSWSSTQQPKVAIPSTQLYPAKDFVLPRDVNNTVPGVIECENFDEGGMGVGYEYFNTIRNVPIPYRGLNEIENIEPINFVQVPAVGYKQVGNYQLSMLAGDWAKYTVNVTATGVYNIGVNVGIGEDAPGFGMPYGGTFHIEVDGAKVGPELTVPQTTPAAPFVLLSVTGVNLTAGQHVVKLVSDTSNADAYYDGSMGMFDSIQILPAAAAPTFAPPAGPYTGSASVTISSTTSGASFAYTTDGTPPTEYGGVVTHGTLYTVPVTITSTSTLTAIAFGSGYADSSATSGVYTIKAATPTYSPAAGTFTTSASVTISSTTPGASFAYTTDGSTPTESGGTVTHGTLYTAAVNITATSTLKAIAFGAAVLDSAVASGTFTIKAATPVFAPVAGTYTSSTPVTISTTTPGASIAYTTDNTTPTESGGTVTHGTLYTTGLNFTATTTLKAIAFKVGLTDSAVATGVYVIKAATPVFAPVAGTFTSSASVTITTTTPGASIAYTTDGTTPTESGGTVTHGTLYSSAVNITATSTLKAIAFKVGITDSAVFSGVYTIQCATPTFGTAAGTYIAGSTTLATTTSGASIAYTTDGSTPAASGGAVTHGTLYTTAITLANGTSSVKALAFKTGLTNSAVASAAYTSYFAQDVGTVGAAGSASLASGTFTVAGAGAGIAGTADAFRMVYLPMSGNCTVTAHVATFTSMNAAAMAGVMVRQSLSSNSVNAATLFKPQGAVQILLSVRTTAGGATTPTAVTATPQYWVRIKRATNTLTAYLSTDGTAWTPVGAATTVTMTGTVYAGLAVTSGTTASTTTATFDNVSITSP